MHTDMRLMTKAQLQVPVQAPVQAFYCDYGFPENEDSASARFSEITGLPTP
jgi:predicted GNAT family N-acyltransferase